jgi:hypothetical protein
MSRHGLNDFHQLHFLGQLMSAGRSLDNSRQVIELLQDFDSVYPGVISFIFSEV